jgi:hypothetical protein
MIPFAYSASPSLTPTRIPRQRSIWRAVRLLAGVFCLVGALALAGCSVTIDTGTGGGDGGSTPPQPGAPGGPGGGTTVKPCPGVLSAAETKPTITLTVANAYKTTQAHVGDVIEVRLSAKMQWSQPTIGTAGVLTALQPQGGMDEQTQTCQWLFAAAKPDTVKLEFTGGPLCEPNVACPAYAEVEQFTLQIS